MMELDSADVLEPVLFSPSSKSHIKYNSIIIMLLDQNNNTSHLCLILLLSILLLVLFYITLFMKTYQAAKLKMLSKSSKKVHHHIHHRSASTTTPSTNNVYKSANGVSTNPTSVYKTSNGVSTSANNVTATKTTWSSNNGGNLIKSSVSANMTQANQVTKTSCPVPPKTNVKSVPESHVEEVMEEKGKLVRSVKTSGGQTRKSPKEKHTPDSLYQKTSLPPRDVTPSPPSPSKPNRKRNPRISEPPPWSQQASGGGDSPPVWLRSPAPPPETLIDGNSSNPSSAVVTEDLHPVLQDDLEPKLIHKLDEEEEEDDDDDICTSHSRASLASSGSAESETFTSSSGVSTGGSRSSNVSCSSNSSDDGTNLDKSPGDSDDYNKENRADLTNLAGVLSKLPSAGNLVSRSDLSNIHGGPIQSNLTSGISGNVRADVTNLQGSRPSLSLSVEKSPSPPVSANSTLTRRQKKNRVRRNLELNARIPINKLSRFYQRLGMKDAELHKYLSHYVMTQQQLINFSFPFESKFYANKAVIYSPGRYNPKTLDPKAREFVPSPAHHYNLSHNKILLKNQQVMWRPDVAPEDREEDAQEKICARCNKSFYLVSSPPGSASNKSTSQEGNYEYLTQEHCHYHWGKVTKSWNNGIQNCIYSCCNEEQYKTLGCVYAKLHVWSGLKPGINGPLDGYVKTKPRKTPPPNGHGVYALDTEMVYTVHGLEVARVTVVNVDGRLIYNTLVKPDCEIIDYNTKYSGISARDFVKNPYKTLRDVQNDLMGFVSRDSLIVGHGLENDLRALKLLHPHIIDTSVLFPHAFGLPYRRSLKSIVAQLLHQSIQSGTHDSFEDARACIDLVLWKLLNDFRYDH